MTNKEEILMHIISKDGFRNLPSNRYVKENRCMLDCGRCKLDPKCSGVFDKYMANFSDEEIEDGKKKFPEYLI